MIDWYQREIIESGKQPLAVLFLAFVVTFLFIRLSVRMIRAGVSWWPGNVTPGGTHVHHVIFGIVFMVAAGIGAFSTIGDDRPWVEIFAALFGCGAALVLDEFALVLHLKDVYWAEQGRTSIDAVFLSGAVLGLLLLGESPFGVGGVETDDGPSALAYAGAILVNGSFVVLALLKGKMWTGLLGVLIPLHRPGRCDPVGAASVAVGAVALQTAQQEARPCRAPRGQPTPALGRPPQAGTGRRRRSSLVTATARGRHSAAVVPHTLRA